MWYKFKFIKRRNKRILKNNIEVIRKIIINYNEKKIFKIIDLLKNGLNIKLIIWIDFTLSNRKPSDPHSLHYYNSNKNNNNFNENNKKTNSNNILWIINSLF